MDTSITPLTRLACEGRHRLIRDGQVTNVYSQRKFVPDEKTVLKGPIVTDYDRLIPDMSLYEVGDRGKTRYDEKYSAMWEWKPAKTKIPQPAAKYFEPGGKKVIKPNPSRHEELGGKKAFTELKNKMAESNEKMCESKKMVMMPGQGSYVGPSGSVETGYEGIPVPRKLRRGEDWPMEKYMNRKQRPSTLAEQRNGIGVAVPGDKAYKVAEHSDNYYRIGGIIPGSTIQLKKKSTVVMKKGADNQARTVETKKLVSYAEKAKIAQKLEELHDVHVLTNPYNKLNQTIPCWEERTGYYIVRPEDEAD